MCPMPQGYLQSILFIALLEKHWRGSKIWSLDFHKYDHRTDLVAYAQGLRSQCGEALKQMHNPCPLGLSTVGKNQFSWMAITCSLNA